jgi:hypothetical protein
MLNKLTVGKAYEEPQVIMCAFAENEVLSASNDNYVEGAGGADKSWGGLAL